MTASKLLSKREAAAELKRLARHQLLKYTELEAPLRRAVLFYWKSMANARKALGLRAPEAPRQLWSRARVLDQIRRLHREGVHMSSLEVARAGRMDLIVAAHTYVGSWSQARALAGVPFKPRRNGAPEAWDADRVVAVIRERHGTGEPLAATKVPRSLLSAANRIFGSWRAAITAAALDYDSIMLARRVNDDEILDWLRRLASARPDMTLFDLDKHGEHAVTCRRRWGSYEAAAKAAGIRDWPRRTRSQAMSRAEVLRVMRMRKAAKRPVTVAAVRETEGGHALINSVLRHFVSWEDAIAAATRRRRGIRPRA